MTKAKKLPDVWVMFDGLIPSDVALRRSPDDSDAPVHRYTPAKPAKVCKCKEPFSGPLCLYCANCGGKVKR